MPSFISSADKLLRESLIYQSFCSHVPHYPQKIDYLVFFSGIDGNIGILHCMLYWMKVSSWNLKNKCFQKKLQRFSAEIGCSDPLLLRAAFSIVTIFFVVSFPFFVFGTTAKAELNETCLSKILFFKPECFSCYLKHNDWNIIAMSFRVSQFSQIFSFIDFNEV